MKGDGAGGSEVRALTLLIQLFGREAIDALSEAGFKDNDAIARAGPEGLSGAAGIPLALARRIVAVAVEAREIAAADARETALPEPREGLAADEPAHGPDGPPAEHDEPAPDEPRPAERHVRRPLRRPHSRLVDPAPAPARQAAGGAGRRAGRARSARQQAPAADADPFIDDVGLVSWMGFAGKGGGAVPFSVADTILDTGPDPAAAVPAGPQASAPGPDAPPPPVPEPIAPRPAVREPIAPPPAPPQSAAAAPAAPQPAAAGPADPEPAPGAPARGPSAADGSFWSFGQSREPSSGPGGGDSRRPAGTAPGTPRRRSHDGH